MTDADDDFMFSKFPKLSFWDDVKNNLTDARNKAEELTGVSRTAALADCDIMDGFLKPLPLEYMNRFPLCFAKEIASLKGICHSPMLTIIDNSEPKATN